MLLALSLAGCSLLPRQGPSNKDMADAEKLSRSVALVDVSPTVVTALQAEPQATLQGTFGDYRPPREQVIGVGDGIQITLWEAAAGGLFSSPVVDRASTGSRSAVIPEQVVARDGSITVPFAGRVMVAGHTPPDVENVIVKRLADKAIDPQALVTVVHNVSSTVTIMRDGGGGALVPLSVRGERLLEVLAGTGGGSPATMSDVSVQLSRDGRTMRVPMAAVLADPRENVFLQPGDVVTLFRDPQTFTAAGAIARNGVIPFDVASVTLDEAVAKAGGLLDDRADPSAVFVVRFEDPAVARKVAPTASPAAGPEGTPVIYRMNMRDPTALFLSRRFPIRNKDIVYVGDSGFSDTVKVLNLFNLLLSPAFNAASVKTAVQ